ncbi:uncharacterized protein BCR38DRAFT_317055, partial [Pseudomassariella vexata]
PSRILEQARRHLEALKQSGLSRETLLALLEEDNQQQQQQQSQQQIPHQNPQQQGQQAQPPQHPQHPQHPHGGIEARSSVSSTASNSSGRESILSTGTGRSSASSAGTIGTTGSKSTTSTTSEAKYWCTACDKTFKRKFDWKRHEEEFHERWRKYPCPNCNQSFWGPNTFNQHHKSAHGCRTCPHSDNVVKYMRKRKAWGCGFCAAMHGKLEKHYEHVASHFEQGCAKSDWLHSNVIYGLLHQPSILEAWRDLVSRKEHKFNGHQPMFSWSPDNTGRAQGYVENESPGQLQDFLEFFDGTKESAEKIARCAWGYCHVVLKPKSAAGEASSSQETITAPPHPDYHHQVSITSQSQGLRRTSSTSLMPISRQPSRRVSSNDFFEQTPSIEVTPVTSPIPQNNPYQGFLPPQPVPSQHMQPEPMQIQQVQVPRLSLDKELPPAPLLPSPMDMDFNMYDNSPQPHPDQMLKAPDMMDDWQSFTTTVIDDPA